MIVSFHILMYFVYNLWNRFLLPHHENNEIADGNEVSKKDKPRSPSIPIPENKTSADGEMTSNDNDDNPEDSEEQDSGKGPEDGEEQGAGKGNSQLLSNTLHFKEGGGDFHPCLQQIVYEDEYCDIGSKMIYNNSEPQFYCNFDPTDKIMTFIPPVYAQRYMTVEAILKEPCWAESVKKVVDFGCSELNFEKSYLKKLYGIEEIVAVDIDLEVLESNCAKMRPSPTDYLIPRPTPLKVQVFLGSVAHTNDALKGTDAVIAIELVEHLFPNDLECLPFTVFRFIKPKLAIFTTPNADFNVLFPGFSGFRHPDHKFEWTQQQFQDWGNNLVQRYPDYQVMFQGIGPGPEGTVDKFGCCTQMATFVKVRESQPLPDDDIHIQDGPYTLMLESIFPKEERTQEQKVQDEAQAFLVRCKLLSKHYDKEFVKEVPLTDVMQRVKYNDKDNLKKLLIERGFRIEKTSTDSEIILLSEDESEESFNSDSEGIEDNNDSHKSHAEVVMDGSLNNDENWDVEENIDDDQPIESEISTDHVHLSSVILPNLQTLSDTKDNFSNAQMTQVTTSELPVSDDIVESCNSSQVERISVQVEIPNLESSLYETPSKLLVSDNLKPNCDLSNHSVTSSESHSYQSCEKSFLAMDSDVTGKTDTPTHTAQSDVPSPCDTSIYATPCSFQRNKINIPKCLSLQQINRHCSSPTFDTKLDGKFKESGVFSEHKNNLSKHVEGFKSIESCDFTNSSTSRVVDSGYPDSYTDSNMDMDLTPEQFDEIETESEGNDNSSRSPSPPPQAHQIPRMVDDVENGDVANNNRDGEGNNLVADMDEEPIQFEARIEEINNIIPNLAAANQCEINEDLYGNNCQPSVDVVEDTHASQKGYHSDSLKLKSVFTESQTECFDAMPVDVVEHQSIRCTMSDSSILTNSSLNLDASENRPCCSAEGSNNTYNNEIQEKIKTQNSLTTVLDGYSKFSNCSLVQPTDKQEPVEHKGMCNDVPKVTSDLDILCMPNKGNDQEERIPSGSKTVHNDRLSVLSVYQSAESLYNPNIDEENNIGSSFPKWLLSILVSDAEENDVESVDSVSNVWDSDSLDELFSQDYDVLVDARGGGDPQRDLWN